MKTITVLSGKGGVGKSSITASLAVLLAENHKLITVDCDVDAPNLALALGVIEDNSQLIDRVRSEQNAILIKEHCSKCQECVEACKFQAISVDKEDFPVISDLLCIGCGACTLVCGDNALKLESVEIAGIRVGETGYGFPSVSAQLNIGKSGSGNVVNIVKIWASEIAEAINAEYMVIDSAAGIGCPVIASVRGSDYVVLVTEPTPAAFWDLKRAIDIVNHFNIHYGVIINKNDINSDFTEEMEEYFTVNEIPVLGEIPFDQKFVYALVNLKPAVIFEPEYTGKFLEILKEMIKNINFWDKYEKQT
ncbi:MAG: cell division inhibitor MinD [Methanobacterium sp. PtaU1.Bin097]|nr:MAG: cell division inhibitor MinD [Methanobacterium sp. PtaU1.Bin097]